MRLKLVYQTILTHIDHQDGSWRLALWDAINIFLDQCGTWSRMRVSTLLVSSYHGSLVYSLLRPVKTDPRFPFLSAYDIDNSHIECRHHVRVVADFSSLFHDRSCLLMQPVQPPTFPQHTQVQHGDITDARDAAGREGCGGEECDVERDACYQECYERGG